MDTVLLTSGIVLLIAAASTMLVLTRRSRFVGPFVAGAVGIMLLVFALSAHSNAPSSDARQAHPSATSAPPVPTATPRSAPAAPLMPVPTEAVGCRTAPAAVRSSKKYLARPPLPQPGPQAVQQLPAQLNPGPPSQGELVLRSSQVVMGPYFDVSAIDTVAPALVDVTSASYVDLALGDQGGMADVFIAVGTPKADDCWYQLAYAVINGSTWTDDSSNIRLEPSGPALRAQHAVLECGQQESWLNECAWAGPGARPGHPVFGVVNIIPMSRLHLSTYSDAQICAWIDRIVATLTSVRAGT
ncbi:hypothetical protein ABIA33_006810 [Streptacidiphilus sp. MAP12-16]|uniref:hypothetical protein n=1 Tax=Streptacidiphilus sp. MAP12-16 TaxID=3156300 RepID=UPI0035188BD3